MPTAVRTGLKPTTWDLSNSGGLLLLAYLCGVFDGVEHDLAAIAVAAWQHLWPG